jgi:glycosyltransferase involved in cell wall biosynthesis
MAVRNEARFIRQSLEAVLAQNYPSDLIEVIVVDGMSEDGTRAILQSVTSKEPRVRVIDNPKRIVSCGLNIGIKHAKGEIIIRMDAHTEYAADYVRQCVAMLRETGADNVGGPARTKAETYMERAVADAYHSPFSVGGARFHNEHYEGPVDTVTYGCWRRECFDRLGCFDEELVRNQDDEHNLRIIRSGGRIWQSPRIKSWYHPRGSLIVLFRQYMQYGYWKVRVIQKHRLPASVRHLVPGSFVATLLALGMASPFYSPAAYVLAGLLSLYLGANLLASVWTAAKSQLRFLPVLPAVFAGYHFGYGYGFLRGVLDFAILRRGPAKAFCALTRGAGGGGK